MARSGTSFNVDTSPDKAAVVDSLTRDVTVEACIFDLIDNSVDAARDTLSRRAKYSQAIAENFNGFEIKITVNKLAFKIEDDCGGIEIETLRDSVMRFGKRSPQSSGIGVFGVGLNRALFKLGAVSHLKTDTGRRRAELTETEKYRRAEGWELPAQEFPSRGAIGTEIEITQLPPEISQTFGDKGWLDETRAEIGRRYGRFLEKGLSILVNVVAARNEDIAIRDDGPYPVRNKFLKSPESGVAIQVRYEQHKNHRFSKEPDYKRFENKDLTSQYGWTIFCNDRAIVLSDRDAKTGWDTKFHSEFYGFVGEVNFTGDPSKLPWNTTKTDVDLNNPAYQLAIGHMRKFAEDWRKFAERRKKEAKKGKVLKPPPKRRPLTAKTSKSKTGAAPSPSPAPAPASMPITKKDHNSFREVLPPDISEHNCFDKHLALINEAKKLDLIDSPYCAMALIRMLFEGSTVTFLIRIKRFDDLKRFAIDRRNDEKKKRGLSPLTKDDENKVNPAVDEMLAFLEKEPSLWGAKSSLRHCVKRMSGHQKILNSVVHDAWQTISWTEAKTIRDDVLPMLRHMIES